MKNRPTLTLSDTGKTTDIESDALFANLKIAFKSFACVLKAAVLPLFV